MYIYVCIGICERREEKGGPMRSAGGSRKGRDRASGAVWGTGARPKPAPIPLGLTQYLTSSLSSHNLHIPREREGAEKRRERRDRGW
ncbi:hypothetical protein Hdeb2414_s0060g00762341 [Helianthus debilis subsp. tardiflorus]